MPDPSEGASEVSDDTGPARGQRRPAQAAAQDEDRVPDDVLEGEAPEPRSGAPAASPEADDEVAFDDPVDPEAFARAAALEFTAPCKPYSKGCTVDQIGSDGTPLDPAAGLRWLQVWSRDGRKTRDPELLEAVLEYLGHPENAKALREDEARRVGSSKNITSAGGAV